MKSQGMRRIFLALDLPLSVKSSISKLLYGLRSQKLPVKWTPVKNLHVTLIFLGNRSAVQISRLECLVAKIAESTPPFPIFLGAVKSFFQANQNIAHIAILENNSLIKLQATLQRELAKMILLSQFQKYRPHITIGRCCRGLNNRADTSMSSLSAAKFPEKVIGWTAREIDIVESILGTGHPQYLRLRRYNFSKK